MSIHTVAFWNVENLFAPEDFQDRPEWLAKRIANDLKGWTMELFELKLKGTSKNSLYKDGALKPGLTGQ